MLTFVMSSFSDVYLHICAYMPQDLWEAQSTGALVRWGQNWISGVLMPNAMCEGNLTMHISVSTPCPIWNMVVTELCYGDKFLQQVQGSWSELRRRWIEPNTWQFSKKKLLYFSKDLGLGQWCTCLLTSRTTLNCLELSIVIC